MTLRFGQPRLPTFLQAEACECGLASLAMLAAYHGHQTTLADLRRELPVSRKGVTVEQIGRMAAQLGLHTRAVKLDLDQLQHLRLPCIAHWDLEHFIVISEVSARGVVIHDPAVGRRRVSMREFGRRFSGVAVECETAPDFAPRQGRGSLGWRDWIARTPGLGANVAKIVLLAALLEALAVLMPLQLEWVIDQALPQHNQALVDGLAVGFALLAVLSASVELIRGWLTVLTGTELNLHWMAGVLRHLLRLPIEFFERRHIGDVASSFDSITVIQRTLSGSFIAALIDGALALGTLTMMAWYYPTGALITAATMASYGALRAALQRPLRQATAEQIVHSARTDSHFLETLRGMQTVRLFGRADQRQASWSNLVARRTNAQLRVAGLHVSHFAAQQLLLGLQRVAVLWLAAHALLDGRLSLGVVFAFLAYMDQFTRRTGAFVDHTLDLMLLRLHVDRVSDILLTPPEPADRPASPNAPADAPPALQVRGLRYAYGSTEDPVLDGVTLDVGAGECVAITGPSGCGKTTLVKLMLGLLTPTSGQVLVAGLPVAEFGHERLRSMAGTVMQDDLLFTGSIADNISFFEPEPDVEHLEHCAAAAAIHDDIMAMPMGYGTLVGESGVGLSGGQKQRVLLARALYRRPRILVLDEATSHLDVAAERSVNQALRSLRITRLVIAHRPDTIAMADRVIRLEPVPVRIED